MNEKLIDMIIQLADKGGTTAIWLYGILIGGTVLKYALGFACLFMSIVYTNRTVRIVSKDIKEGRK